ncbi:MULTISPECIES: UPF0262 family protein [Rhizobium]|uniref:UPF0262 family protein n=3 Tax=Rhizobium TaxID=379 RepID=A0A6P1CCG1_RHITR|nr:MULTISPECIES: UPF0262 family protein [Rhizobium]AGB73642.1 hypothetical protein RTCIAT899_PB01935 [Rhizobium tropici CIAT 899]AYG70553.1 UPF0262 family protein [Rhizobium sp. CCGE531]ENN83921.1 hypothetical protein RHSP_83492 [Rhizobium freirei PRF 81]MBB4245180.1 uncharacterized protein (UPF0262 family) [Rhizobium tropici]MBB5596586.1 uncharacterized protein (UPF0262 family) [Rhizobium tropici]
MASAEYRLCDVSLDRSFAGRDARIEREQALAVIDLLESNTFIPVGHDGGPYRLTIAAADGRLALHVADAHGEHVVSHYLSLTPFRRLLKDYTRICESYYDAIRHPGPERLEAIDMGRRGVHNEAAELLKSRLSAKVNIDNDTARRLFTLIYALLVRNADRRVLLS